MCVCVCVFTSSRSLPQAQRTAPEEVDELLISKCVAVPHHLLQPRVELAATAAAAGQRNQRGARGKVNTDTDTDTDTDVGSQTRRHRHTHACALDASALTISLRTLNAGVHCALSSNMVSSNPCFSCTMSSSDDFGFASNVAAIGAPPVVRRTRKAT